jgi:hypothetical protein
MNDELARVRAQRDAAYSERDCCVVAIAAMAQRLGWPCGLSRHDENDASWDRDWLNIVYVDFPTGQCSWHIHDSELAWFAFLSRYERAWDGHTTVEKYARIGAWAQGTGRVGGTAERQFRVLRGQSRVPRAERDLWPATLPWSLVEPWRAQAERNHSQTLERLNERGGLAPEELWLAAHGLSLRDLHKTTESAAGAWLRSLIRDEPEARSDR